MHSLGPRQIGLKGVTQENQTYFLEGLRIGLAFALWTIKPLGMVVHEPNHNCQDGAGNFLVRRFVCDLMQPLCELMHSLEVLIRRHVS